MYNKTFEKRFNTNILYIRKLENKIDGSQLPGVFERSKYFETFLAVVAVCVTNGMFIDVA